MEDSDKEPNEDTEDKQKEEKKHLDWKDILALVIVHFWYFLPLIVFTIAMGVIIYILLFLMS